jgi:hypothetical protein
MDKVQEPSNSACYTPLSEHFRFYFSVLLLFVFKLQECCFPFAYISVDEYKIHQILIYSYLPILLLVIIRHTNGGVKESTALFCFFASRQFFLGYVLPCCYCFVVRCTHLKF